MINDGHDLQSLLGWSLKDWLIRPRMLAVIDLRVFQLNLARANRNHCKLLFSGPKRISVSALQKTEGLGFVVRDVACAAGTDCAIDVQIRFEHDGFISISAEDLRMFIW